MRISYDPAAAGQKSGAPRECWSVVLVEHILPRPDASGRTLYYTLRTGAKVYVEPPGLTRDGQVSDVAIRTAGSGHARPKSCSRTPGRATWSPRGTSSSAVRTTPWPRRSSCQRPTRSPARPRVQGRAPRDRARSLRRLGGPRLWRQRARRCATRIRGAMMRAIRFPRRIVLRCAAWVPCVIIPAERAAAQTLTIVTNGLQSTVTPVVSDFRQPRTRDARCRLGAVTLDIDNCPNTKTCSIECWPPTSLATGGVADLVGNESWKTRWCAAGEVAPGGSGICWLVARRSSLARLTANGNAKKRQGIAVQFGWPVSWSTTPNGSDGRNERHQLPLDGAVMRTQKCRAMQLLPLLALVLMPRFAHGAGRHLRRWDRRRDGCRR